MNICVINKQKKKKYNPTPTIYVNTCCPCRNLRYQLTKSALKKQCNDVYNEKHRTQNYKTVT